MIAEKYLILGLINLAMTLAVGACLLRRPAARYFSNRSNWIKKRREEAAKSLKQAQDDFERFKERMENIVNDIRNLLDSAEKEGEALGREMLFGAEKTADRIIEQSMIKVDQIILRKNRDVYRDVVERSLKSAEEKIAKGLDIDGQVRLCRTYLKMIARTAAERR